MNSRRAFLICLGSLLVLQQPLTVMAAAEGTSFEEYRAGSLEKQTGAKETIYTEIHISTEEELAALAENCHLDSWSEDKRVILDADIALSRQKNIVIPSFGGIFEGNGHKIEGINITETGSAIGLFRYLQKGGVIRKLTVTGMVNPSGSRSQVGGIVGVNYGNIENCSVGGLVTGDNEVGGIAGVNADGGTIRSCKSYATVIGNHSTGGIAGNNYGVLNNCSNSGAINIYNTEVSYNLDDITVESLEDINSTSNVAAHTDSGGIAGLSSGKIYYCANTGTVGYHHVGYNAGGIVGRLSQGYLQNCTNSGHVMGRKDVGGIAGQLEPFLEVQYLGESLQRLDREADKFIDLLDAAHKDLSSYGKSASTTAKGITADLKKVNQAGSALSNTSMDLWYIYNQELTGINNDLKTLNQDLKNESEADTEQGSTSDVTVSSGNIGDILDDIRNDTNVDTGNASDRLTVQVPDDTESYKAALRRFGDSTGEHLDKITSATNDRTGGIRDNLQIINSSMESAGNGLEQLTTILEEGTDAVSGDIDAVVEQAKVLRGLLSEIRDDLFRYEGIAVEDNSDEAAGGELTELGAGELTAKEGEEEAYYDTTSFQKGKITRCVNQGLIEADTNVGGIVGQIATEYDIDPEDDITVTGAESFDIEQTVKAVVRESRNLGDVVGKKDCVGGVVGKAEHGAIISCESYGTVTSTDGSCVGGIAGAASYAVRSCYTMGELSGKDYVGGIVGRGCDIFYSYAYNSIERTGENAGAIAGQLEDEGILYGNYYVAGDLGGVDGIGYSGGATPLSYEEFISHESVPAAFSDFVIIFMAEGKELAAVQCKYGDAIGEDQIPEIPVKEGYYGVWQEYDLNHVTGNKVLEVQYNKWITTLADEECDKTGKPMILVEGKFYPDTELQVEREGGVYTLSLKGEGDEHQPIQVRALCENMDNAVVEVLSEGGYQKVASENKGSYLVFDMEKPGTFRIVQAQEGSSAWKIWVAAGVLLLTLLLVLVRKHKTCKGMSNCDRINKENKS